MIYGMYHWDMADRVIADRVGSRCSRSSNAAAAAVAVLQLQRCSNSTAAAVPATALPVAFKVESSVVCV